MATTIDLAESQLLLAHVLGVDQAYLLAHPKPRLNPWQRWRYARLLARRAAGWPVAYLLGERWFYGRPFYVNRHTLIPRPETETVVEIVIRVLETLKHGDTKTSVIIDVGTGCGCIAVTLAAELHAPVIATDVSRRALATARRNASRNGVAGLITLHHGNLLGAIRTDVAPQRLADQRPTIIVANLPYLPSDHPAGQTPFEPTGALYGGGADGLDSIRALVGQISEHRNTGTPVGAMVLEIDPRQAAAVRSLLADRLPPGEIQIHDDLSGRPRVAAWVERGT